MPINYQLRVEKLSCQRGDNILFENLSCVVQSGDFVQVEGRNGIGKTSFLRILTGLSQPLQGDVFWNGVDIRQQRENYYHHLLYLGHHSGVKPELSAWENLTFYQKITHCQRGDEAIWAALQQVGLLGREDLPAGQLSAGQMRRIALARLWLSQAPLWVLDEPFTAIDKKGIEILTALFETHIQRNGMVILTSHQDVPSQRLKKISLEKYKVGR